MSDTNTTGGLLSRTAILTANDLVTEDVEVPEWGGVVRIKTLSGAERDAFEGASIQGRGKSMKANLKNLRARLVVMAAVDENGKRLFEPYDVEELGKKSSAALDRCFEAAQRLSKISDEDVEEMTADFPDAQSEPSTSA